MGGGGGTARRGAATALIVFGALVGTAAVAVAAPSEPPAPPEAATTSTTSTATPTSPSSELATPEQTPGAAPVIPPTTGTDTIAESALAALGGASQPTAAGTLPVDEDLGEYGPTPPPPELSDAASTAGTPSTAGPALAGTGALSNRLARMGVILALAGILFVVADRSERSRAIFAWAYRAPTRRARDLDDLLPGRGARVRATLPSR